MLGQAGLDLCGRKSLRVDIRHSSKQQNKQNSEDYMTSSLWGQWVRERVGHLSD